MSDLDGTNSLIALGTNGLAAAAAYSDLVQGPLTGLDDSLHDESSVEVALRLPEICITRRRRRSLTRITKYLFFY